MDKRFLCSLTIFYISLVICEAHPFYRTGSVSCPLGGSKNHKGFHKRNSHHRIHIRETHSKSVGGQDVSQELLEANQFFLKEAYPDTLNSLLDMNSNKPVILVWGRSLVLIKDKQNVTINVTPDLWVNLKMACHMPLSTFLIADALVLNQTSDAHIPLDTSAILKAKKMNGLAATVASALDKYFVNETLLRQQKLMSYVSNFTNALIYDGYVTQRDAMQFADTTVPLIKTNIWDAVVAFMDSMHKQVMTWKAAMTSDEWNNLKVVVAGGFMARHMEMHMQYFARLLHTDMESGERLMFDDHVSSIDDLIQMLGVYTTDFTIGSAFFHDPQVMHSDVQAEAAKEYLKILLPERK